MILKETIFLLLREFFDNKMTCVGLITGQNPQEVEHNNKYNSSANERLLDRIKSMGHEPFPTHYYGEEGFLIPNITKSSLISLGREFNQRAVVWGSKLPEDKNGMTFNWEYLEDGKIRNEKISHHPFVCPKFN